MATNLLQAALSGNEKSLLELTWQLQNHQCDEQDIAAIIALKNDRNANEYSNYLEACLHLWGSDKPKIETNYAESLKVLDSLITTHKSSYAMNLYIHAATAFVNQTENLSEPQLNAISDLLDKFKGLQKMSVIKLDDDDYQQIDSTITDILDNKKLDKIDTNHIVDMVVNYEILQAKNVTYLIDLHNKLKGANKIVNNSREEQNKGQSEDNLDNNLNFLESILNEFKKFQGISTIKTKPDVYNKIVPNIERILVQKGAQNPEDLNYIANLITNFKLIVEKNITTINQHTQLTSLAYKQTKELSVSLPKQQKSNEELLEHGNKMLAKAAKLHNPLAIVNAVNSDYSKGLEPVTEKDTPKDAYLSMKFDSIISSQPIEKTLQKYSSHKLINHFKNHLNDEINNLAIAYAKLNGTHYMLDVHTVVQKISSSLTHLTQKTDKKSNRAEVSFYNSNEKDKKVIAQAWLKLAEFYKNIGSDILMFHALQQAVTLDKKHVKKSIEELGGVNMSFDKIINHFESFKRVSGLINNKLQRGTPTDDLKNNLFILKVTYQNCKLLLKEFSPVYAMQKEEYSRLVKLSNECKTDYLALEAKLDQKVSNAQYKM